MTDIALPAAIDSHTLLVAAVIVHDREAGRVLLLQRAEGAKFAALHRDLPVGKAVNAEPHKHAQVAWFPVGEVPEKFVLGVRAAMVEYLDSGQVFLADNF